jgi:phosphoribosylamine---glycine ligase
MPDKYIVIGKGGREHALAALLGKKNDVYSFGGSDRIRAATTPLDADRAVPLDKELDDDSLRRLLAEPEAVMVFGPEQPMALGWVDQIRLKHPGAKILGPHQYAAQLESSKWWAKEFMVRNSVPTGEARRIKTTREFDAFALQFEAPYVIKADGLAAGKGVAIIEDATEARAFVEGIVSGTLFGAPQSALIEEFMTGPETSIFLLLDGSSAAQIGTARDYKRVFDDNQGPNTGGMGSFTPVPDVTDDDQRLIYQTILRPILDGLKKDGLFYKGFLYVGLMRTPKGFRVLEFNVRMGDPETQAVLPVIADHLPTLLSHAAHGALDALRDEPWMESVAADFLRVKTNQSAVCVVLAAPGYPGSYQNNLSLPDLDNVVAGLHSNQYLFYAGTKRVGNEWVTAGGRVLNVVATGSSVPEARQNVYDLIAKINYGHLQHRTDIAKI